MTTLKIVVEDYQAGMLKSLLKEVSFVKSVEEDRDPLSQFEHSESTLEQIKKYKRK